jgi:hypothetical protein
MLQVVQSKFERCKSKLISWQRKKRGNTENILQEKHKELAGLQFETGPPNMQQIKKLQEEV